MNEKIAKKQLNELIFLIKDWNKEDTQGWHSMDDREKKKRVDKKREKIFNKILEIEGEKFSCEHCGAEKKLKDLHDIFIMHARPGSEYEKHDLKYFYKCSKCNKYVFSFSERLGELYQFKYVGCGTADSFTPYEKSD